MPGGGGEHPGGARRFSRCEDTDSDNIRPALSSTEPRSMSVRSTFNAAEAVEFPVTFGDFVRLYEDSAK